MEYLYIDIVSGIFVVGIPASDGKMWKVAAIKSPFWVTTVEFCQGEDS